ncbi:MAG TPA: glycosyltransferase family 87 protein [Pseudolabrys sp.]|nr:glycosyltransferase family 87 protein [Pseudolabrys sp.]
MAPSIPTIVSLARRGPSVVLTFSLFIYFALHATRFRLANVWPLQPRGDASVLYEESRRILNAGYRLASEFKLGEMNTVFAYPPSAVLIFNFLGVAGPQIFVIVWWTLMFAGLVVSLRLSLVGDRLEGTYSWLAVGALGLVVADGAVMWDLRNANCNVIYLGLVLLGYATVTNRPVLGGLLIGISVSLKVYSLLIVFWLLLGAPRRAFTATIATMVLLWIVLPAVLLGPTGTVAMYSGWFEQLAVVAGDWGYSMPNHPAQPPLVTLRAAAMAATGTAPFAWQTQALVGAGWAIWFAVLAWYAWRARKIGKAPSRAALSDWTVLLLAPLPLSPWLEPYHAVPALIGAIICILVALDSRAKGLDRLVALGAVVALALDRLMPISISAKGFDVFARFLLLVLALAYLRPRLDSRRSLVGSNDLSMARDEVGFTQAH